MPSTDRSRVKTTGRGEIEYVDHDSTTDLPTEIKTRVDPDVSTVTATNIGFGEGLFAGSNGYDRVVLEFKSIAAGPGIHIADDGHTLTISATGEGGGPNPGSGDGPSDGFELILGDVATKGDGSWQPGAVHLTNQTSLSDAVDSLNEVLGKLIPAQPPAFGGTITVANTAGTLPLLATNFTDNSQGGHSLVAGNPVTRIVDAGVNSQVFQDVGPGDTGTLSLNINGVVVGSRNLNGTTDNGTYSGLRIADQKDFPVSAPGFWKSIDVSVVGGASPSGLNKVRLEHTAAGTTPFAFYVRDSMTAAPVVTNVAVTQVALGAPRYSSGVPHYDSGAKLRVAASSNNFAGQTYYGGSDPLVISSAGPQSVIVAQNYAYSALGINTPISSNSVIAVALNPVEVNVDGNTHGFGWVSVVSKNVNGSSAAGIETTATTGVTPVTNHTPYQVPQTKILVMRGAATGRVAEASVPVTGLGSLPNNENAVRVRLAAATDRPSNAVSTWDGTTAVAVSDATVVAGAILHDQTDYSKSFLPVGPNYSSGRSGAQYITFEFSRTAVSTFKINVTGTYAGCWVRLPGVTDNTSISPNATGGWLDASKAYDGAGVPGEASDPTAGCAQGALMVGGSGSYTITFGPQTSTNATGNKIQVRFRLNAGQSITALSFSN